MGKYVEKELVFNFPDELTWNELDVQGRKIPKGMALVDLVIERESDCLLVEIKDPSNSAAPEKERNNYLKRLQNNSVLEEELVPKVRDSYTYEHLMERDHKPFVYIVLIGLDSFSQSVQTGLLSTFGDRLHNAIKNESDTPWIREHISQCTVLSIPMWNRWFKDWQVSRLSVKATKAGD